MLINGGADIGRQFLNAGLLDEVLLHLVPVVLGDGTPSFDSVRSEVRLVASNATRRPLATHLTYEVERAAVGW